MNHSVKITLCLAISLFCLQDAFSQNNYSINGNLGLDTVPQHKLDVNGDGYFKGELTLDDNLRMTSLASTDSLIEKLLYVDQDGRMQRLGGDGADMLVYQINNGGCLNTAGQDPIVYWNAEPGKLYAHSSACDFTPNVGIGTKFPETKLDVRGISKFENVGVGVINDGSAKLQLNSSLSGLAFLVTNSSLQNGEIVYEESVKIHGSGNVILNQSSMGQWDYGIKIIPGHNDLKSFSIRSMFDNSDRYNIFGDGRIVQNLESSSSSAYSITNTYLDEEVFQINRDGHTEHRVSGVWDDKVITVKDVDVDKEVFVVQKNGAAYFPNVPDDNSAINIKNVNNLSAESNVIINGNGETVLQGMGNHTNGLTILGEIGGQSSFKVQGNGYITQNVSGGEYYDKSISIHDADAGNDVFTVHRNGEIKMLELGETNHAFTARIKGESDPNVIIRANGRINLRGVDIDNQPVYNNQAAFNVHNSYNIETFRLRGDGVININYAGSDNNIDVFSIATENQDGGKIFRIDGNGRILAASVHVRDLGDFNFPDYVFEPGYDLMSLEKLRRFIKDNQRLPNMPSAEEVERNGLDLGEMNRLLVEKVEELTLYVLELEKRLNAVEKK